MTNIPIAIERSVRFQGIEALRAFAAVSIILFHLASSGGAALPEGFSFIGSHFGFGVPLFFVVSGFSLAHGYYDNLATKDSLSNYYIRRFFRIAPLFYFIMVLQLINLWLNNNKTFSIFEILINATFTFNLIPSLTEGIVPASWTIGIEMIFYLLFPLIIIFFNNIGKIFLFLCISIVISSSFTIDMKAMKDIIPSFIYHNFIVNFPYFIWGVLGYHLFKIIDRKLPKAKEKYLSWLFCLAGVICVYTLYANSPLYQFFWTKELRTTWDSLWGIPFVFLCISMALHSIKLISNSVSQYLGKISFSLYLIHPTIVYEFGQRGVYSWIYELTPDNKLVAFLLSAILSILLIASMATITFLLIEKPGMNLGKYITKRKN